MASLWAGCRPASQPPPLSFRFSTHEIAAAEPGCGDRAKREQPCATFRLRWQEPEHGSPEALLLRDRIRRLVGAGDWAGQQEQFLTRYREARPRLRGEESNWFWWREAEVLEQVAGIVTLQLRESHYEGGGIPANSLQLVSLLARGAVPLEFAQVVDFRKVSLFTDRVETRLAAMRRLPPNLDLTSLGYQRNETAWLQPDSFGVLAHGLRLRYRAGSAAPADWGDLDFTLKWEDLRGVAAPRSPVLPLLAR